MLVMVLIKHRQIACHIQPDFSKETTGRAWTSQRRGRGTLGPLVACGARTNGIEQSNTAGLIWNTTHTKAKNIFSFLTLQYEILFFFFRVSWALFYIENWNQKAKRPLPTLQLKELSLWFIHGYNISLIILVVYVPVYMRKISYENMEGILFLWCVIWLMVRGRTCSNIQYKTHRC